jgi:hypothetical protein
VAAIPRVRDGPPFAAGDQVESPLMEGGGGHRLIAKARELVESGWTQYADARNNGRVPVRAWSGDAVCWSLLGALVAAYESVEAAGDTEPLQDLAAACHLLADVIDSYDLDAWNNARERTQANVLATLDAALRQPDPTEPAAELPGRDRLN